jgi:antitoxin MazE
MDAKIIKIGNSQGVRIPKPLLKQAGLSQHVRIMVKDGMIIIANEEMSGRELAFASEASLAKIWNDPREDEAWKHLQ